MANGVAHLPVEFLLLPLQFQFDMALYATLNANDIMLCVSACSVYSIVHLRNQGLSSTFTDEVWFAGST